MSLALQPEPGDPVPGLHRIPPALPASARCGRSTLTPPRHRALTGSYPGTASKPQHVNRTLETVKHHLKPFRQRSLGPRQIVNDQLALGIEKDIEKDIEKEVVLPEQMLTVVNPDKRLVRFEGIDEPYCERLGHEPGDLSTVQPGYFGSLCGRLRGTR